jgi:dephospho-CoA kinase
MVESTGGKMLWIGLTGGLGTGKSSVANILRRRGHLVIDADEMARLAVGPGSAALAKVVAVFGREVLDQEGHLDRRKLGAKVFTDPAALADLEAIVHPEVKKLTLERRRAAEADGRRIAFYDVPLLFEKKMESDFDKIVVVAASGEQQMARTMARDGLTRAEVEKRLASQIPVAEKVKRAKFVIDNTGTEEDLELEVDEMLMALRRS